MSTDFWPRFQGALKKQVSASQYRTWLQGLELRDWNDDQLTLVAPSRYTMAWITRHFLPVIQAACQETTGTSPRIELEYSRSSLQARAVAPESPQTRCATDRVFLYEDQIQLSDTYTFDHFVVGPCNHLAHAAALAVAEAPALCYNPLFVHGNVGLGKTHLLQAICHASLKKRPNLRLYYVSCETFVNQFIAAIERRDLDNFRNRYRKVDLLLIDDIHYLAYKERTQEEFFHTFNTLYNAKKQIVLSSDSSPKEIPMLEDRLVSRFKWGLVTRIDTPAFETHIAIINQKAKLKGFHLPSEVAAYIAEHIDSNIRELEGAINRVMALAALKQVKEVTLGFAHECLRDLLDVTQMVSVGDIIDVVTREMNLKQVDLQSRKRTKMISFPRHLCMYLAQKMTNHSLEEIGRHFGGPDESSVEYAVRNVSQRMTKDEETRLLVSRLEGLVSRSKESTH